MHIGLIKYAITKGGGISQLALTLAERLCASDIDVSLICTDTYRSPSGVRIIKVKLPNGPTGRSLFFVKNSKKALREIDTDINLVLWHPGDQVAFFAKRRKKIPYIMVYQGISPLALVPGIMSKMNLIRAYLSFSITIPAADAVVAISDAMCKEIKKKFSVTNLITIPNGIDINRFSSNLPPEPIKKAYNVSDQFTLLYVGRIAHSKGLVCLIKAAKLVKRDVPDFQLILAGKGPLEKDLLELTNRMGLSRNVKYLGFVPDHLLPYLYAFCDIFIFPTLWEGFGYPPLEAMASGKPVIASNLPSIRRIVGDAGILVPPNDPNVLAMEILKLIEDKNRCSQLGIKARNRSQVFDWSTIILRYKELIKTLTS